MHSAHNVAYSGGERLPSSVAVQEVTLPLASLVSISCCDCFERYQRLEQSVTLLLGCRTHPVNRPTVSLRHVVQLDGIGGRSCDSEDSICATLNCRSTKLTHTLLRRGSLDAAGRS